MSVNNGVDGGRSHGEGVANESPDLPRRQVEPGCYRTEINPEGKRNPPELKGWRDEA